MILHIWGWDWVVVGTKTNNYQRKCRKLNVLYTVSTANAELQAVKPRRIFFRLLTSGADHDATSSGGVKDTNEF